ncbi:MAG: ABC transporter permease, partial [Candidatus Heimdallarchaeaceae archaeon]
VSGLTTFITQTMVGDSYFSSIGWNTAVEQWIFMGAAGGILIGLSVIIGYLYSRKLMGNSVGLSFILLSILMLLFALPELKDLDDNNKILVTCVVVLAFGTIIWIGVNLSGVTDFIQALLYRTKLKKGVSLIASKYMTSKTIRSTLTFGIFTLVLTMNIFASIYQTTYSYNTLESVEFLSGGAPIYIELDTPIENETLVNPERDLYQVDPAITYVKGINHTFTLLQVDKEASNLDIPSDIFAASVDLIYNNTFKNGSDYVFDFMFDQSLGKLNEKYKPDASESYQSEYSHEIWDFFYNRTKFTPDGEIDQKNGLPTVITTSPAFKPGDVFNISGLFKPNLEVIVLAVLRQYPFTIGGGHGFPSLLITPDLLPYLSYNFAIYPKYIRFLVKTSEDFREGRNSEIANEIEAFFNGNESVLIQHEDFVAASAYNVWDEMLAEIDFQVRTFDFMQIFVSFGLVVGAIGMVIIAIRNVSERKREIGMMRAIGYKKSQIIQSITLELFILAGLGLFMGLFNSIILGWTFARLYDWYLVIPWLRVLLYTGVMIVIAFIASIIPGIRASRITPAEALRYVG